MCTLMHRIFFLDEILVVILFVESLTEQQYKMSWFCVRLLGDSVEWQAVTGWSKVQ